MHIFKSLLKGSSLPPHLIKNLSFKQIIRNYPAEKAIKALTEIWMVSTTNRPTIINI